MPHRRRFNAESRRHPIKSAPQRTKRRAQSIADRATGTLRQPHPAGDRVSITKSSQRIKRASQRITQPGQTPGEISEKEHSNRQNPTSAQRSIILSEGSALSLFSFDYNTTARFLPPRRSRLGAPYKWLIPPGSRVLFLLILRQNSQSVSRVS